MSASSASRASASPSAARTPIDVAFEMNASCGTPGDGNGRETATICPGYRRCGGGVPDTADLRGHPLPERGGGRRAGRRAGARRDPPLGTTRRGHRRRQRVHRPLGGGRRRARRARRLRGATRLRKRLSRRARGSAGRVRRHGRRRRDVPAAGARAVRRPARGRRRPRHRLALRGDDPRRRDAVPEPLRRQPDPHRDAQPPLRREGLRRALRDARDPPGRAARRSTSTRRGWSSRRRWSSRRTAAA